MDESRIDWITLGQMDEFVVKDERLSSCAPLPDCACTVQLLQLMLDWLGWIQDTSRIDRG